VGSGSQWNIPEVYTVSTSGIACSTNIVNLGTNITFTMKVHNLPQAQSIACDNNNPGALIYAVTSNDCPCAPTTFYSSQACLC